MYMYTFWLSLGFCFTKMRSNLLFFSNTLQTLFWSIYRPNLHAMSKKVYRLFWSFKSTMTLNFVMFYMCHSFDTNVNGYDPPPDLTILRAQSTSHALLCPSWLVTELNMEIISGFWWVYFNKYYMSQWWDMVHQVLVKPFCI